MDKITNNGREIIVKIGGLFGVLAQTHSAPLNTSKNDQFVCGDCYNNMTVNELDNLVSEDLGGICEVCGRASGIY